MNYQVDRIAEEAKQLSYEELKAASELIPDMLDEMDEQTAFLVLDLPDEQPHFASSDLPTE